MFKATENVDSAAATTQAILTQLNPENITPKVELIPLNKKKKIRSNRKNSGGETF